MALDSELPSFKPEAHIPIEDFTGWELQTFSTPNPILFEGETPAAVQAVLDNGDYATGYPADKHTLEEVTDMLGTSAEIRLVSRDKRLIGLTWIVHEPTLDEYFWDGMVVKGEDAGTLSDILFLLNDPEAAETPRPVLNLDRLKDPHVGIEDPEAAKVFKVDDLKVELLNDRDIESLTDDLKTRMSPELPESVKNKRIEMMKAGARNGKVQVFIDKAGEIIALAWNRFPGRGGFMAGDEAADVVYLREDQDSNRQQIFLYLNRANLPNWPSRGE